MSFIIRLILKLMSAAMNVDAWSIGSEKMAEALGVPEETFRTWRGRHGLLAHVQPGRGRAALFNFADALDALLAHKMMKAGVNKDTACHYVNSFKIALHSFVSGEPVQIGIVDGEVKGSYDPQTDPVLSVPLDLDGWKIAQVFIDDIGSKLGANEAADAKRELDHMVAIARNQRQTF